MAIITNTINGMTEISASSGKYLTQSYPTNFHEFYSKKMILPDDSVDNYKEVTETEKTQIETQDAKWEEPSKELIERWNEEWWRGSQLFEYNRFGFFNTQTGFFEGNGIKDITTSQAKNILSIGLISVPEETSKNYLCPYLYIYRVPTILPIMVNNSLIRAACSVAYVKVIRIVNYAIVNNGANPAITPINVANSQGIFYVCPNLEEVKAILNVDNDSIPSSVHFFDGLRYNSLKEIKIINLKKGINLRDHLNLNIDCVDFMVENAKTVDAGQTITLHPNVYAKVSDELFGKASNKNITIATTE